VANGATPGTHNEEVEMNKVYPSAIDLMMTGELDLAGDTLKASLIDLEEYTYSATDTVLDDVAGVAIVATSDALADASVLEGVFDATDAEIADVEGPEVGAVLIFKDTTDPETSPLVAFLELAEPVTPNGGKITIEFGADGIIKIAEPVEV
jgi:hypothetical protein